MPKNNYNYIRFKVLTYLYGALQGKYYFDENVFRKEALTDEISKEYATNILRLMQNDGHIAGLAFTRAWGDTYIITNSLSEIEITSEGIVFLLENSSMNKIKNILESSTGLISELVRITLGI